MALLRRSRRHVCVRFAPLTSVLLSSCTIVVDLPRESSGGAGAAGQDSAGMGGGGGSSGGQAGSSGAGASGNAGGGSTGGTTSSGGAGATSGGAESGGAGGAETGGRAGAGGAGGSTSGSGGAGGCPDRDDDGETDAACGGTDCDDNDGNVYSGQTEYFATERDSGGYDYNCSGEPERETNDLTVCSGTVLSAAECNNKPTGFLETLPPCGSDGDYGHCMAAGVAGINLSCDPVVEETRTMRCH